MKPTALVTGATGFVGTRLCESLVKDIRVKALVRHVEAPTAQHLRRLGVELVQGDLADHGSMQRAVEQSHVVYHVAEKKSGFSWRSFPVNVDGTRALINAAHVARVQKFVYVSSAAVNLARSKIDDPAHREPNRFYPHSLSKALGEQYGLDKARREGLAFTAVRPAFIYSRTGPVIQTLVKWMRKHPLIGFPVLGPGHNLMQFGHVDDLVAALRLVASRDDTAGKVYTIVDDRPMPWNEFLGAIAATHGLELRLRHLPIAPVKVLAAGAEWLTRLVRWPIPLRMLINVACGDFVYSNRLAREELGFRPQYPTLIDGLHCDAA